MSISPTGSAAAIGLSGMRAAQRNLDTSAHNIANLQTPDFQRQQVVQTEAANGAGVKTELQRAETAQASDGFGQLPNEVVAQTTSVYNFAANLKTVQTQDEMLGSLLDAKA